MPELTLGKKDVIWSYLAQFLSMGAGVITLPFILHMLTADEIGLNYILVTVGSIIALVDLGFAPQFARNFTYVFSGAQEFRKEGIGRTENHVNYELLGYLLKSARYIYGLLALGALILLLGLGTPYLWHTTKGFTLVKGSLCIWIVYSFGILFQVFYSYYFSMLIGAGKIKEQKYALIANKIVYIGLLIGGLYAGWGLLSVAIAQFVAPFFGRFICHRHFYTRSIRTKLDAYKLTEKGKVKEILKILWYNAKRTAIMSIGAFAILRMSMFIAGLYLSLEEFGSYGLMVQIVSILGAVSTTFIQISQSKFASMRTTGNSHTLLRDFAESYDIFLFIFLVGSAILLIWGNPILSLIGSNAVLPDHLIVGIYCLVMLLENNHGNFAILISTDNKVPFAPASIITGIFVCLGIFLVVRYTDWGILGLVAVQGICQAAYQNWKWPAMALHEFHISLPALIKLGATRMLKHFRR